MGGRKQQVGQGVQRSPQLKKTRPEFVCCLEEKAEGKDSSPSIFKFFTERKRLFFTSSLLSKRNDGLKIGAEEILEEMSDKHLSGVVLVELILPRGRAMDSMIYQGPSTLPPVAQNSPLEPSTSLLPCCSLSLDG